MHKIANVWLSYSWYQPKAPANRNFFRTYLFGQIVSLFVWTLLVVKIFEIWVFEFYDSTTIGL